MHRIAAGCALALLLLAPPALAQQERDRPVLPPETEEALRKSAEDIMRTLRELLKTIPQYGLPEVNENGDIVIPRRNPPEGENPPAPEDADTPTTQT